MKMKHNLTHIEMPFRYTYHWRCLVRARLCFIYLLTLTTIICHLNLVIGHSLYDSSSSSSSSPQNSMNNINSNSISNQNINQNQMENSLAGHHSGQGINSLRHSSNANGISLNGGYQNRCPSSWMWLNNKCWMITQSRRDFSHANELCKKLYNQSTLATIHSQEENEFLRQKVDLKNSPIWLYARHNHQYNKTRWLDRSPVNYTNWDVGQPNDKSSIVCIKTEDNWYMKKTDLKDGQAECVSFWEDGHWSTQVGCQVLLPVVCEKKLLPMAKYQVQPNGSEPSFDSINGGSLGQGSNDASALVKSISSNHICLLILSLSFISTLSLNVWSNKEH